MSQNTTHFVLRIKENVQCKEGIFNDALGEKLGRNFANSANDRNQNCRALLPSSFIREIREILGWDPYQREYTRN